MNRPNRHAVLACLSAALVFIIAWSLDSPDTLFRLSMATAYTGLLLLAATLLIGPLNLLRNRSNPLSSYLRRDIGIWAGLVSIAHVVFGLQVHMGGRFWIYFVHDTEPGQGISIRFDMFGLANHAGLAATLVCVVLLVLSNNLSLQRLGGIRWKKIQRLNYLLFILVIGHGFAYQVLEKRPLAYFVVVGVITVATGVLQWRGSRVYART